jgi:hypothetical protein
MNWSMAILKASYLGWVSLSTRFDGNMDFSRDGSTLSTLEKERRRTAPSNLRLVPLEYLTFTFSRLTFSKRAASLSVERSHSTLNNHRTVCEHPPTTPSSPKILCLAAAPAWYPSYHTYLCYYCSTCVAEKVFS